MQKIICHECKNEFEQELVSCPSCGAINENRKTSDARTKLISILIVLGVAAAVAFMFFK